MVNGSVSLIITQHQQYLWAITLKQALLTFIQKIPSWFTKSHSASQEIPHIWLNLKVRSTVYKIDTLCR